MVRNVFHLDDRQLSSLMVPRADIEWLEASVTVAQSLQKVSAASALDLVHSWYPVCRGSLDDVVGVISVAQPAARWARRTKARSRRWRSRRCSCPRR